MIVLGLNCALRFLHAPVWMNQSARCYAREVGAVHPNRLVLYGHWYQEFEYSRWTPCVGDIDERNGLAFTYTYLIMVYYSLYHHMMQGGIEIAGQNLVPVITFGISAESLHHPIISLVPLNSSSADRHVPYSHAPWIFFAERFNMAILNSTGGYYRGEWVNWWIDIVLISDTPYPTVRDCGLWCVIVW